MQVIVEKLDPHGMFVWRYDGALIQRTDTLIVMEARFKRDIDTDYFRFQTEDRMVEYYYNDRGYNVFAIFDRDSDALRGFYCNITHPAEFIAQDDAVLIRYRDLHLDLFVYPDGHHVVLDEDELAAANLPANTLREIWDSLAALHVAIAEKHEPFR